MQKVETNWSPLSVFLLPILYPILQAGRPCDIWFVLTIIPNQSFDNWDLTLIFRSRSSIKARPSSSEQFPRESGCLCLSEMNDSTVVANLGCSSRVTMFPQFHFIHCLIRSCNQVCHGWITLGIK